MNIFVELINLEIFSASLSEIEQLFSLSTFDTCRTRRKFT